MASGRLRKGCLHEPWVTFLSKRLSAPDEDDTGKQPGAGRWPCRGKQRVGRVKPDALASDS